MDSSFVSLLTAFAALLFVVCLIWLAGRALRLTRLSPAATCGKRLSITDSLAIGPRRRLLLIRCDGKDLLLLTGGAQDILLGWVP
jgi:flagellar protein FliO/FliZ